MKWVLLLIGFTIASAGSAAAAALVSSARTTLAEAISRRLRGSNDSLAWVSTAQRQVMASTAASSLGVVLVGVVMPGLFGEVLLPQLVLVIAFLVVPIALLGGYLFPRWLTVPRTESSLRVLGPIASRWSSLLSVVLPARSADPTDDVKALAREGSANGLGGDELVMVGGVMTFAERPVRGIMTPRTDMIAIPHDATHAQVFATFVESGYTRIPVYRGTLDEITGMIHAFDFFKQRPDEDFPVRPVSYAPETRPAGDLLLDLQRDHRHLAVILDEFGGTAGIVTFEDLLEGLVGEISDEDDIVTPRSAASGMPLEVDGSESPDIVAQHFGVVLPTREAASFGGLIAELIGRIPMPGERFTLRGLDIDVVQASPTHIARLLVRRGTPTAIDLDRVPG